MSLIRCHLYKVITVVVLLGSGYEAKAQLSTGGLAPAVPRFSAASYYYVSKPGELTMQVNVWGFVGNPGRYEVPTSTDLVQLLSYAGGPIKDAVIDKVKVTRSLTRDAGVTRREFYVDLEDLTKVDPANLVLYPGDTVFIDHSGWLTVRDVFTVLTTAAVITAAVASLIRVTQR
jgi:hypothetical protein